MAVIWCAGPSPSNIFIAVISGARPEAGSNNSFLDQISLIHKSMRFPAEVQNFISGRRRFSVISHSNLVPGSYPISHPSLRNTSYSTGNYHNCIDQKWPSVWLRRLGSLLHTHLSGTPSEIMHISAERA